MVPGRRHNSRQLLAGKRKLASTKYRHWSVAHQRRERNVGRDTVTVNNSSGWMRHAARAIWVVEHQSVHGQWTIVVVIHRHRMCVIEMCGRI